MLQLSYSRLFSKTNYNWILICSADIADLESRTTDDIAQGIRTTSGGIGIKAEELAGLILNGALQQSAQAVQIMGKPSLEKIQCITI